MGPQTPDLMEVCRKWHLQCLQMPVFGQDWYFYITFLPRKEFESLALELQSSVGQYRTLVVSNDGKLGQGLLLLRRRAAVTCGRLSLERSDSQGVVTWVLLSRKQ